MASNCEAVRSASACGRQTFARRRLLHFQAVFVHAGDEQRVAPVKPVEPGEGVGGDPLIGVADMRRAIGVREWRW